MIKDKPLFSKEYYKRIVKLIHKYDNDIFHIISNYGLYSGDTNLFKVLTIKELVDKIKGVPGDIIEFGVWNGNTSFLIKKILDIYKIKKKLYLFDHFKGLIHYENAEKSLNTKYNNKLIGNKKRIIDLIKFFKFKNIHLIDKDATTLDENYFKGKKFCLIICDVDLYRPTLKILESVEKNISKKGIILFDEGNMPNLFPGEKKALQEFYKPRKNKFTINFIRGARQPDVYLKRIR